MILSLTNFLIWCCEKTGRVLTITGTAGPDDVYLIRYFVVRSRFFNIFIHRFLRSDRDDLHDHPWHFCTYLVNGSYTENKWNPKTKQVEKTRRENELTFDSFATQNVVRDKENVFVVRKATDQHQVLVDRDYKVSEKEKAPLTICVTGPTIRDWGFIQVLGDGIAINGEVIKPNTRQWVDWREYLGLPSNTPGRG